MLCGSVWAGSTEETFAAASAAYKTRNERLLESYAQQLRSENYLLAPYAEYWLLQLHLEQVATSEVQSFLTRYNEFPFSDQLRAEWLKQLGKRQDWNTFFAELPRLTREDVTVTCYTLLGRDTQGDASALRDGKVVWLSPSDRPSNCDVLFDRMQQKGMLSPDDLWARVRLVLTQDNISVARSVLRRLPPEDTGNLKQMDSVYENPQRALEKKMLPLKTRFGRELAMYAVERVSRNRAELALDLWNNIKGSFSQDERAYLWGRMAYYAAKRHAPEALEWFGYADDATLSSDQLAWKARAALRVKNWDVLLATVAAMPDTMREDSAWRYWKGRALKEKGQIAAANALLLPLSRERTSYYGLLAGEELGDVIGAQPEAYKATDEEVRAVQSLSGIQRALALSRYDLRWEAKKEWVWATRNFDDKHLIAAAELAFRQELYDLAINAADKTSLTHDFTLRYPTPYRDLMQAYVRDNGLDEAWVYGLIRQESRFQNYARSNVGASGVMQVMPATAKWIAKRMKVREFQPGMIHKLDTNLQFGTFYLRHVLDNVNGQALVATAAYNAGPSRAKRWVGTQPLEGSIYAETIPFSETRDYVQKVLGNAYFYASRLGLKLQPLKQRLGLVTRENDVSTDQDVGPE